MDTAKYHRFIDAISTDIVGSNTPNQQSDTMSSPAAEKSLSDARAALLDRLEPHIQSSTTHKYLSTSSRTPKAFSHSRFQPCFLMSLAFRQPSLATIRLTATGRTEVSLWVQDEVES
jgi:hypothetical protein